MEWLPLPLHSVQSCVMWVLPLYRVKWENATIYSTQWESIFRLRLCDLLGKAKHVNHQMHCNNCNSYWLNVWWYMHDLHTLVLAVRQGIHGVHMCQLLWILCFRETKSSDPPLRMVLQWLILFVHDDSSFFFFLDSSPQVNGKQVLAEKRK